MILTGVSQELCKALDQILPSFQYRQLLSPQVSSTAPADADPLDSHKAILILQINTKSIT